MSRTPQPGTAGWIGLTVGGAAPVRQWSEAVAGWPAQEHRADGYAGFVKMTPGGKPAGGVRHSRGAGTALPPVWRACMAVEDLDARMAPRAEPGGQASDGPRAAGGGRSFVLWGPAGAPCTLQGSVIL